MSKPYSEKIDISIADTERKEFEDAYRNSRKLRKSLLKRSQSGDAEATALLQSKFGVTIHRKGD